MTTLQVLAVALAILPLFNTAFVFGAFHTYLEGQRHPILFAFLVITLLIWATGGFIGVIAARSAVGLPSLPGGGMILGLILVAISLLPGYIWAVMRRFRA